MNHAGDHAMQHHHHGHHAAHAGAGAAAGPSLNRTALLATLHRLPAVQSAKYFELHVRHDARVAPAELVDEPPEHNCQEVHQVPHQSDAHGCDDVSRIPRSQPGRHKRTHAALTPTAADILSGLRAPRAP